MRSRLLLRTGGIELDTGGVFSTSYFFCGPHLHLLVEGVLVYLLPCIVIPYINQIQVVILIFVETICKNDDHEVRVAM